MRIICAQRSLCVCQTRQPAHQGSGAISSTSPGSPCIKEGRRTWARPKRCRAGAEAREVRISHRCRARACHAQRYKRRMGHESRSVLRTWWLLPVCVSIRPGHGAVGSRCDIIYLPAIHGTTSPETVAVHANRCRTGAFIAIKMELFANPFPIDRIALMARETLGARTRPRAMLPFVKPFSQAMRQC